VRWAAIAVMLLGLTGGCGDDEGPPSLLLDATVEAGRDAGPTDGGTGDRDGNVDVDAGGGVDGGVDGGGERDAGPGSDGGPLPTCSPTEVLSVAVGPAHTCAVRADSVLFCWGTNDHGELGLADTVARLTPTRLDAFGSTWSSVTAGSSFTCGIAMGMALCWGHNMYGRLGVGDTDDRSFPAQVMGADSVVTVSAGGFHACAIQTLVGGLLACWGHNPDGRVGAGDTVDHWTGARVELSRTWTKVTAGGSHTCAVATDRTLRCWGGNSDGQLGLGTFGSGTERTTPQQVGTEAVWVDVSAGTTHTCAVRMDGSLWCWGSNALDQLGLGPAGPARATSPTRVGTESGWSQVSAGAFRTCAVRADGTLWCWGANGLGELGVGDTMDRDVPTRVGTESTWTFVQTRAIHTCGLLARRLMCWGGNRDGELGTGDTTGSLVPIPACVPAP